MYDYLDRNAPIVLSGGRRRMPVHNSTDFDRIFTIENLMAAYNELKYDAGQAPGVDRIGFGDLGRSELWDAIRSLHRAIHDGTYRPLPARPVQIKKSSGKGYRTLKIRTILDRTVSKVLQCALSPIFEKQFLDGSYGFRTGRSSSDMLIAIAETANRTGCFWFVQDDIRNAFDEVRIDDAISDFKQILDKGPLVNLLEAVIRGGEPEREIGTDQGSAISPLVLNVRLNKTHDIPIEGLAPSCWFRYADNVGYLAHSALEAERLRDVARDGLERVGLILKGGTPSNAIDLRRRSTNLLGFRFRVKRDGAELRVDDSSWENLQRRLERAHEWDDPPAKARQIIRSWTKWYVSALTMDGTVANRLANIAAACGVAGAESSALWSPAPVDVAVSMAGGRRSASVAATCDVPHGASSANVRSLKGRKQPTPYGGLEVAPPVSAGCVTDRV